MIINCPNNSKQFRFSKIDELRNGKHCKSLITVEVGFSSVIFHGENSLAALKASKAGLRSLSNFNLK